MAPRTPFPGPHGDPFPARRSWPERVWRAARGAVAALASVMATYLGGCVAALVLYAAMFPPITGVQLQRQVEGLLAETPAERTYRPRPLPEIDPALPWAVVAAEDTRFFQHAGINWKAVGEALEEYHRGEELRGASSITQQLVKNLFMTTHSTYLRKALEVPLAYAAEAVLSKRRILELYVNVIEWGPGVYGAEAAAQHHYGQSAGRLTRAQAAALAACIPNPRVRRPATMGWYQRIILRRMAQLGPLPLSHRPAGPGRGAPSPRLSHRSPLP